MPALDWALGPAVDDLAVTSHRLRLMGDAYGLADRNQVVTPSCRGRTDRRNRARTACSAQDRHRVAEIRVDAVLAELLSGDLTG
jgi:hypothetical protein